MRKIGYMIIRKKFNDFNASNKPVMVYLHPRDIDPDGPHLQMPIKRRFKCCVNVKSTEKKLMRLLENFSFMPLRNYATSVSMKVRHLLLEKLTSDDKARIKRLIKR